MSPESIAIIGAAIALTAVILPSLHATRRDLAEVHRDLVRVRRDLADLRERMARLASLFEGFTRRH